MKPTTDIIEILAVVIAALFWFWLWWHVTSKIGYRGLARKLWVAGMCIPPLAPPTLMLLLVFPWPVCKQLRQARTVPKKIQTVDDDLDQMRRKMRG